MSRKSRKSRQAQAEDALDEIFQDPDEGAPYSDEVEVYNDALDGEEHLDVQDDVHEVHLDDHFEQAPQDTLQEIEDELQEAEDILEDFEEEDEEATPERSARTPRVVTSQEEQSAGGGLFLVIGTLVLVAGLIATIAGAALPKQMAGVLESLSRVGATPATFLVLGAVLAGIGALTRRQSSMANRIGQIEDNILDGDSGLAASLDFLVEAQEHHAERAPASGEELERVLIAMQRQDEKINNLTRATKMYGKPLVEVTKQLSEMASRQEAMRESLKGLGGGKSGEDLQKLSKQLEDSLKGANGLDDESLGLLKEIRREVAGVATTMARLQNVPATSTAAPRAAASPAPSKSGSTSTSPAPAAAGGAAGAGGDNVLAQSISGTQRSTGKGVMGSIAKLKQMRK